jgi:hypothetical protein
MLFQPQYTLVKVAFQSTWWLAVLCLQVRMSALNGLVALCQLVLREARVAHLLPLVRRHMQPLELELPLQRTLAAAFPRLLAAVSWPSGTPDAGATLPPAQQKQYNVCCGSWTAHSSCKSSGPGIISKTCFPDHRMNAKAS